MVESKLWGEALAHHYSNNSHHSEHFENVRMMDQKSLKESIYDRVSRSVYNHAVYDSRRIKIYIDSERTFFGKLFEHPLFLQTFEEIASSLLSSKLSLIRKPFYVV